MKNLILAMLLGISAHSAVAEIRKDDFRLPIDEVFIAQDFHFTVLSTPDLEYGSAELWLHGMMILDFFFYPDPVSTTSNTETSAEIKDGPDFTSHFVSLNFPCGHFGNWTGPGFFPTSSSDTDIQDCGLQSKPPISAKSIHIDLQPIPEPKTYAMILIGLMLMGLAGVKGRL